MAATDEHPGFPQLIEAMERTLHLNFLRHADKGARLLEPEALASDISRTSLNVADLSQIPTVTSEPH